MEHLSACPICNESHLSHYLACKDHTVSHETFLLEQCPHCGFVMTNPRPDKTDLPKYYHSEDYISHSDASRNIVDSLYKVARTFTLKWKYNLIQQHAVRKASSILDYGCGTGDFLLECKKQGMTIAGIEPSPSARQRAIQKTSASITPVLTPRSNTFDTITLWHVLEHVSDLHQTLTSLKAHLAENGTMFIALPNLQSRDAKTYKEHWAGYDVPRHLWHFSRDTMSALLKHHDLKLVNVVPMILDAFYVSMLSEKYRNGKYGIPALAKALVQGWKSNQAAKTTGEFSSLIYIASK